MIMETVSIIRFAYEVRGVVKFLSHLDILKLFNRALLRAGLPVAYSEGFNPHAKISFGPPRGVGQEGLREYCDLQLKECELTAAEVCERLDSALPKGVRVLEGRFLAPGEHKPALMAAINLAVYEASFGDMDDMDDMYDMDNGGWEYLRFRLAEFTAADKVEVVRHHPKKRDKVIDLKAGVGRLELCGERLVLEIPFGADGSVKPVEVLDWLVGEANIGYRLARVELLVVDGAGGRRRP